MRASGKYLGCSLCLTKVDTYLLEQLIKVNCPSLQLHAHHGMTNIWMKDIPSVVKVIHAKNVWDWTDQNTINTTYTVSDWKLKWLIWCPNICNSWKYICMCWLTKILHNDNANKQQMLNVKSIFVSEVNGIPEQKSVILCIRHCNSLPPLHHWRDFLCVHCTLEFSSHFFKFRSYVPYAKI